MRLAGILYFRLTHSEKMSISPKIHNMSIDLSSTFFTSMLLDYFLFRFPSLGSQYVAFAFALPITRFRAFFRLL
jgi:hypothetical protein